MRNDVIPRALEDLIKGLEALPVEGEDQDLVVDVNVASHDVPGPPLRHRVLGVTVRVEPHELSASVIIIIVIIIIIIIIIITCSRHTPGCTHRPRSRICKS